MEFVQAVKRAPAGTANRGKRDGPPDFPLIRARSADRGHRFAGVDPAGLLNPENLGADSPGYSGGISTDEL
jgi:hypothetical protein